VGEILLFQHSSKRDVAMPDGEPLAVIDMFNSVFMTPVVANGVLFVASKNTLYAIASESGREETTP
jgi:hypothetical protein